MFLEAWNWVDWLVGLAINVTPHIVENRRKGHLQ